MSGLKYFRIPVLLAVMHNLLDILSRQFQSNYTLTKYITIDEGMIPFKGRLGFNQYSYER